MLDKIDNFVVDRVVSAFAVSLKKLNYKVFDSLRLQEIQQNRLDQKNHDDDVSNRSLVPVTMAFQSGNGSLKLVQPGKNFHVFSLDVMVQDV